MTFPGEEEAALLFVPELFDHLIGERDSGLKPSQLTRCFIQGDQPIDKTAVILEVGIQLRLTIFVGPEQQTIVMQMGEKKTRVSLRDLPVVGSFENGRRFSEA